MLHDPTCVFHNLCFFNYLIREEKLEKSFNWLALPADTLSKKIFLPIEESLKLTTSFSNYDINEYSNSRSKQIFPNLFLAAKTC